MENVQNIRDKDGNEFKYLSDYGNYKFRMGMFYGYMIGSFLMFILWALIF